MDYCVLRYPSGIQDYRHDIYSSLEYRVYNFLPYYGNTNDLSVINQFIDSQSSKKSEDEVELMFSEKVGIAKALVIQILSQIKEREIIKERNFAKINYDMGRLSWLKDMCAGSYALNMSNADLDLEKQVVNLEKEKRTEQVSCWRDLVNLKKDLMGIMAEYKTTAKKKKVLSMNELLLSGGEMKDDYA